MKKLLKQTEICNFTDRLHTTSKRQLIEKVMSSKPLLIETCLWFNDKLDHGTNCSSTQEDL